jgi:hypothetical protein
MIHITVKVCRKKFAAEMLLWPWLCTATTHVRHAITGQRDRHIPLVAFRPFGTNAYDRFDVFSCLGVSHNSIFRTWAHRHCRSGSRPNVCNPSFLFSMCSPIVTKFVNFYCACICASSEGVRPLCRNIQRMCRIHISFVFIIQKRKSTTTRRRQPGDSTWILAFIILSRLNPQVPLRVCHSFVRTIFTTSIRIAHLKSGYLAHTHLSFARPRFE